jgi:hypothetical protein
VKLVTKIRDELVARWRALDPKLKYTVLTFAVARILLAVGVSLDPATETIVSGVIAGFVGYRVPNDGTVLRGEHDNGNAEVPSGVKPTNPPPVGK